MSANNFWIGVAAMALWVISCSEPERPPAVLDQGQMTSLLVEVYLAESRISLQNIAKDSGYRYFVPFEDSLLRKRAISDSALRKSYEYYLSHPAELEKIYAAVVDSLNLRLQQVIGTPAAVN